MGVKDIFVGYGGREKLSRTIRGLRDSIPERSENKVVHSEDTLPKGLSLERILTELGAPIVPRRADFELRLASAVSVGQVKLSQTVGQCL